MEGGNFLSLVFYLVSIDCSSSCSINGDHCCGPGFFEFSNGFVCALGVGGEIENSKGPFVVIRAVIKTWGFDLNVIIIANC